MNITIGGSAQRSLLSYVALDDLTLSSPGIRDDEEDTDPQKIHTADRYYVDLEHSHGESEMYKLSQLTRTWVFTAIGAG